MLSEYNFNAMFLLFVWNAFPHRYGYKLEIVNSHYRSKMDAIRALLYSYNAHRPQTTDSQIDQVFFSTLATQENIITAADR